MISGLLPLPVRIAVSGRTPTSLFGVCHGVALLSGLALAVGIVDLPTSEPLPSAEIGIVSVGKRSLERPRQIGPFASQEGRATILALVQEHRQGGIDRRHRELADAIFYESVAANVDPLMVASIVARESSFKSRAVSPVGAVGLMQLRPFVARDVARSADLEWRGLETLHDPEINLRLGILYYKQLVERFDGDPRKALTAYNFGPTRVSRELRSGKYNGSHYADRVIELHARLSGLPLPPA